jgi:hypothetical protein
MPSMKITVAEFIIAKWRGIAVNVPERKEESEAR